jgi:Xaa-Pro dipeptidase
MRTGVSRRAMLRAMTGWTAGGGLLLRPVGLLGGGQAAGPARYGRLPGLPTGFSLAERDRRWQAVRRLMRVQGFDCLVTPAVGGEGDADSLYLAGRRGWVVFPLTGRVTLVVDSDQRASGVEWVDDVREAEDGRWSPPVIEAMRELKLDGARIGVGRLDGVLRNQEGEVPYTTLHRMQQAFARARFESAADLLMRVKLVRSAEEIAVLEQATAAGERGIEAMIRTSRPGVEHKDVWLAVFAAMTEATGETPQRLAIRAGNEANTSTGGPMLERLEAGQIMNQELAARVLGYMAQVNHSICIGHPPPPDWEAAGRYCLELFDELVDWIRPGKRFLDLCKLYVDRARARSDELSPTWVLVHTCGFGDGPRMGYTRSETRDLVIEAGMVFTLKPRIVIKGTRPTAQFGDPVLVTETGARRLGKRKLELISTT